MSDIDDKERIKRRGALDRIERRKELEDIFHVLSSEEGRRFYWRLLKECGIFRSSMTGNNSTFFNEGMRQIGLVFLADLNDSDPSAYFKMLTEEQKKRFVDKDITKGDENG